MKYERLSKNNQKNKREFVKILYRLSFFCYNYIENIKMRKKDNTMDERTDLIASICLLVVILLVVIVIAYNTIGMIDDHNCWLDDYRAPECRKYVEGE